MFQQFLYHHHLCIPPSALLFPAVNPRRRYLIHNTVQENFPQLTTLSVGQGDQRRTAVTFKKNCNKQGSRFEDEQNNSCLNDRVNEDAIVVSKQQVQQKSQKHQSQPRSQSQSQSLPLSQSKQQSQPQYKVHSQSQSQGQSLPNQQTGPAKKEEKTTNTTGRTSKESRRPEQLLYSPQKQGSLQRVDLRKEAQQQSAKQQQQQSHSNQGTPQQQQQQQKELAVAQSGQHRRQEQHPATQHKQQKSQGQENSSKLCPPEEIPRGQRDNRSAKRDLELAGKPQQQQEERSVRERSRSCNSETRSSSVHSTLETTNDRLRNDDLMRDSGAEESQSSSCSNSRKRRNRRNRRQRDSKTGEGGIVEHHQQHDNDHGHVNGKQEEINKGKKTRKSESLQNLSGSGGGGGSGVTKSASGGEICDDRITPNISNKYNNAEFNDNCNKASVQRASESSSRKLQSQSSVESVNWRDNNGKNRQQNNIRSPVSSWKEEFRESGSSSPSDNIVKDSPARMPVTVPSEHGNNRRRGKAPAQIYRPPPARSNRDTNLPPQQHQQQTYYNHQQQQIQLHQPAYSQQFQPKQLFSPSHNYMPQHPPPSQPPNNYQQLHNYYPQQQEMHHYHSLPRRQRNDSESSTATLSGENQNNRGKGRRPDQVLYVPRGRRNISNDPGSARGTPTPSIDFESHPRPPSPAYSICSTASEFSGRNRYNKQGSRQGSQISIYDGESDRVHGKPPLSRDFSRESTPGYGRQKGNAGARFSSQTLQLIERCLNHDSDLKYNEYSNSETDFNSSSPKNNRGGGGRVQKSPTPTRDIHSIHSKENVIHPIEPSSRSRRSRKNRRRHSRSRDTSADQYHNVAKDGKGNGNHNGDWQNSPGERGLGSCERIFYNSNFNSSQDRYDRGYDNYDRYSSINSSRASSRNSSRERTPQRNINHNWRGGSNPPSPSKGPIVFYQARHSPGKPPSGRLGSLPNVALDCGESPQKLSNHNEENQRFYTLPGKSKSPVINDLHTQIAEKNNIEYGSGCIVSDRIDTKPCMDTSQNTSLGSDLMHQYQSSETHDNHKEELSKSNINSPGSNLHSQPVSGVINQLQECNLNKENRIYSDDSSIKEVKNNMNNSVNGPPLIEEESSTVLDENLKNESHSEVKNISSGETLNKSTDLISATTLEEEVYCDIEAEPSMTESTKDSAEEVTSSDNDTKDNLSETKELNIEEDDKKKNPKKFQFNWADEVEDSWDNLYDDDGECLDPEIKRQLSDSFGKIKLEKPANDYYSFQPKEPEINEEEYGHVIEIYDFPASFKTQDLMMVFSSFQNTGFDIKWVDDTHALGIFATALIAAEALSVDHPFLKTRSLSLATKSSKAKAMRIAEALLPYKPRPATSASLARRLVSGALGLKVNISREVREAERQKLKDAKAQKRLAAKQRVDAWEGNLT